MRTTDQELRAVPARYARLAALCRMQARASRSKIVARELNELADSYDRRRLQSA